MSLQQIVRGFARSAASYDHNAQVQLQCAERLAAYMDANSRGDLIDGPILEIGCGTGLFSRRLLDMFPERETVVSDICDEMLARCRMRLSAPSGRVNPNVTFNIVDAQEHEAKEAYAMIAAAFALQWIEELPQSLSNLNASLKPGGKFFFSLPTSGSFPEWKATCKQAGVPFTGNTLPDAAMFREFAAANGLRLGVYEETFVIHFNSMLDFLRSLKSIGAGTSIQRDPLSVREMRKLLAVAKLRNPNSFPVTYRVLFGNFRKG